MAEIFESSVRPAGDYAGCFEFDGEVGYFYLYAIRAETGRAIVGAIPVCTGDMQLTAEEIEITWSSNQEMVGLLIDRILWAAFDCRSGEKFGGNFSRISAPHIPPSISREFR